MAGQKREARLRARRPGHLRLPYCTAKDVDARDKPGHDGEWCYFFRNLPEAMRGSRVTGQL